MLIYSYLAVIVVEMDTVVGCKGSHKVFLTLFFSSCKLMLIYFLPDKSTFSKKNFDTLEKKNIHFRILYYLSHHTD